MNETGGTHRAPWRLDCTGLSVRRGPRAVLHDIDLSLAAGECLSLIGPNGSGKTTLMLALLGLLPPAAGGVCLNGTAMHDLPSRRRGRFASYVPQIVEHIPSLSIRDVAAGGRYAHVSPLRPLSRADHEIVDRALAQCGLIELADRPITEVSGGERQKALLAAAIAQDADVMFLDEPNTALDPAVQVELVALLRAWHGTGRALVVISHDLQLPSALGGRVVALRAGRVVVDAPAPDVLQPSSLAAIYGTEFEEATTASGTRIVLPRWNSADARA